VATARGVTQVSSYVDTLIASLISASAVASLGYAQLIATLPVSLFGMSVSASELPEMASASGSDEQVAAHLRGRLDRGLAQVAYFVVPSAIAFLSIGHVLAALLFESGRFSRADSLTVWSILGASAVGLLAATMGRLYSSSFYALRDTRSPLRYALVRVGIGLVLGVRLPAALGIAPRWATAGLALAAAIAACVEFALLRRGMNARVGRTGIGAGFLARIVLAAVLGAVAAWAALAAFPLLGPKLGGIAVAGTFGIAYLFGTYLLAVPQARGLLDRIRR
jgi:putative peptidoglycan lipid II flippase